MEKLIVDLRARFGARLLYVGLQGSFLRGEANEQSDIDAMVVLDELSVQDLADYREALERLGDFERSCGFICGKSELAAWNALEICHLLHSTKDLYGKLAPLVPAYTRADVETYVKVSLNNLYHELCHRYIHAPRGKAKKTLPFTYKGVFFILQNMHYLRTGDFVGAKRELLSALVGADKEVLEMSMALRNADEYDFEKAFALIFDWCKDAMT